MVIDNKQQCPEFPHFGAHYPDAACIDGFLWDLDSNNEEGLLTHGGDDPCPFCNTEAFIEHHIGEEIDGVWEGLTREKIVAHIDWLKERYGNKTKV